MVINTIKYMKAFMEFSSFMAFIKLIMEYIMAFTKEFTKASIKEFIMVYIITSNMVIIISYVIIMVFD